MLKDIIVKIDNWENKTAQEIYDEFSSTVKTKKSARYTWTGLRNLFPSKYLAWKIALTTAIEQTFKDNLNVRVALEDIMEILSIGDGPDFSNDLLQSQIDQVVKLGILSQEDANLLKDLGFSSDSNWLKLGGTGEIPSVELIQQEKTYLSRKEYDVLLSVNRTSGYTLMSYQLIKNGIQERIGSLSETSSNEKDAKLAQDIEQAILAWLGD